MKKDVWTAEDEIAEMHYQDELASKGIDYIMSLKFSAINRRRYMSTDDSLEMKRAGKRWPSKYERRD